jgi:hypothetical protein
MINRLMKTLEVKMLEFEKAFPGTDEISEKLDNPDLRNRIDTVNWKEFDYKPDVAFSTGYTKDEILLKYFVREHYFKAEKTSSNQDVYEDSCVEFFVSPADDGIYYNFEFNAIGTCLMETGTGRENRPRTDPEIISRIIRKISAGTKPVSEKTGYYSWDITLAIPFGVFFLHNLTGLKGKTLRANFYKCGDRLKVPHYLTWSPVVTAKPDYHRPEFFGILKFI